MTLLGQKNHFNVKFLKGYGFSINVKVLDQKSVLDLMNDNTQTNFKTLTSFFTQWLSKSLVIVIMWIFAIAGSFGHIWYSYWFKSSESITFHFLLLTFIIVIPTTIALLTEFKNKLPRDKSAVRKIKRKYVAYAMIAAALVTCLIAIELVAFAIKFNLLMTESIDGVSTSEDFKFWKEIGSTYSLYIVPLYLLGMAYWIKKLKF